MNMNFVDANAMPQAISTKEKPQRRDTLVYVFGLLQRFLVGQHRVFLLAFVMLIIEVSTAIFEAAPLGYLINYLNGDQSDLLTYFGLPAIISPRLATIVGLTLAIIFMAMLNSLADSLAEIYLAKGGRALGYNLRLALYTHLQRLSLAFHNQRRTGDILTRITGDVSEIENFVIGSLSDIVGSLLQLIGTMAFLFYRDWQIALVALVIIPVMTVVSNYFSQRIKTTAKTLRAREGDLASASQEMLTSIRVIQTYNGGGHELQRFAEHNQKAVVAALMAAGLQARFSWVVKVLEALSISTVVWVGVWLIDHPRGEMPVLTVGMLFLFIYQIKDMFKPTRKIIKEWNTIAKIYSSVERIGELLDRKPAVSDSPNAIQAPPFRGHVEFQHVSFTYQSDAEDSDNEANAQPQARQVLKGVSFEVALGEVLALVGHTGAGKSTIIQLLSRLYDPSAGQILIDGEDIRRFTLDSLRNQISVVLQETVLFNGTVADNIAYGRTNATREEIIQAAVQANAHEFIERLPEGYDTPLGERANSLSGGQRQRIAIARAFIRNTPILILDEPTTGLDAESSELVLLALRMLMRGKTTIIVSHDFKLVRQANKIVVLRQGRIEQMGDHQELLKTQGTYANLYTKQFGQNQSEEEGDAMMLVGSLYDLLHSPAFQQKWPGVRTAFNAEAMQTHLQNAFFADGDYTIVHCKPGKASYLDEGGCLVRYELRIEHTLSGQTHNPLLLARIFSSRSEAETYLNKRLVPLAAKMKGRPEIKPFVASPLGPIALLETLNMVVSVFPIDGELPMLITATDRHQMLELLRDALPEDDDKKFSVEDCSVEPGHYGRQHRCVLRYELDGHWVDVDGNVDADAAQNERQIVYGKVAADDRGKLVGMVVTALHRRIRNVKTSRQFRMPRILGYEPNLHLILLESIPGVPRIAELIQAHLEGTADNEPGTLTLTQALKDCAYIASALHKVEIKLGQPRTLEVEWASLQTDMQPIQEFSLALAMQLQKVIKQVQEYASQTQPLPIGFGHGDFTYTQLIFADTSCGLVDFDTSCEAEPALDLGQFLAYVRLAVRKAERHSTNGLALAADELCNQFLNAYMRIAGYQGPAADQLRARVAVYEIISLLRIAQHSWQKMKGSRLEIVADLLEERVTCLPPIVQEVNAQPNQPLNQKKSVLF